MTGKVLLSTPAKSHIDSTRRFYHVPMDYDDPGIDLVTLLNIAEDLKDRIAVGDREAIAEFRRVQAAVERRRKG